MIGRLEKTVLDCPDPHALAAFYAAVLGMRITEDSPKWVVIGSAPGARHLAFQRVAQWTAPNWPDSQRPQQLHLDIRVDDIDTAEPAVLALGARRLPASGKGASASTPIPPATCFAWYSDDAAPRRKHSLDRTQPTLGPILDGPGTRHAR